MSRLRTPHSYGFVNRRVPQVLLLHSGAFDALALDEMLTSYDVEWITLDEALSDPVYQRAVRVPNKWSRTLHEQHLEIKEVDHPPFHVKPVRLLDHVCRG